MLRSFFTLSLQSSHIKINQRLSEWHLAFVMASTGFLFLLSPGIFDLPPYAIVSQIASQTTWGSIMISVGGARIGVLFINGSWCRSPHFRWLLAAFSSVVWSIMLAGLLTFTVPLQIGPFLFAAIIVEFINAFRAAQDARLEDESGAKNGKHR